MVARRVENEVPYRRLVTSDKREVGVDNVLPVGLARQTSPFDEVVSVRRSAVFAHTSTDPLSLLRDVTSTTGSGAVTATLSEFRLNAPASGDLARLETAEKGRYVPGFAAEAGIGIRLASRETGGRAEWGMLSDGDGFTFRVDDDGMAVAALRSGSEVLSVPRAQWNVDRLDGTGPSGLDISDIEAFLAEGHVWQIRFTWYGYGQIEWVLVGQATAANPQGLWPVHRAKIDGATSINDPNLPVTALAEDGADLYVGGRQYSVYGTQDTEQRAAGDYRLAQAITASATPVPLIAIRRRSDADWPAGVRIVADQVDVTTTQDLVIQIFIGATVSGGSWVTPRNNGESAVEVNRSATSVSLTGAVPLDPALALSGQGNSRARTTTAAKRTLVPRNREMVLTARTINGQNATVNSILDWLEIR